MSTQRSDEEPLAHDAADEFLNIVLEDADVDLHTAIAKAVNLDAGLAAIIGPDRIVPTSASGQPNTNTPPRAESNIRITSSRSILFQWWTNVLLALRAFRKLFEFSTNRSACVWYRPTSTHDSHIQVHIEIGNSTSQRQSLAAVYQQIGVLAASLAEVRELADSQKQRDIVLFCAARLGSFRKTLENGEVTRDEAEKAIADVQQCLKATFGDRPINLTSNLMYPIATVGVVASSFMIVSDITRMNFSLVFSGLGMLNLLALFIYFYLFSGGRLTKKRARLTKIDRDLAGLKRVVHRLFDDADDLDFDRSGLPR
jgi:hypothetical protein